MTDEGPAEIQRKLAFAALLLQGAAAAVAPHANVWIRVAPPAALLFLAAFGLARPGPGAAVAVLGAAISVIALAMTELVGSGSAWQLTMPLALALFVLASRARPGIGPLRQPLGRVPVGGTALCASVTPFALVAWFALFQPDLSNITETLPKVGPLIAVLGGIAFAIVTALGEELIWRGVIQTRLSSLVSSRDAIFLQALSFGVQHTHGFPRGVVGVALAGSWAIALGMLRKASGGLLAVFLAHFVADATIATIVVISSR